MVKRGNALDTKRNKIEAHTHGGLNDRWTEEKKRVCYVSTSCMDFIYAYFSTRDH